MGDDVASRLGRSFARRACVVLAAVLALAAGAPAGAVSVSYLPVAVAGQNLWSYDYTIAGTFGAGDILTIEFPDTLYDPASLTLSAPPATLDALSILPAVTPGTSSLLQLTAPTAASALTDHASVTFVWLGAGTPANQPFSVESDLGALLGSGNTVVAAAVPEPAGWLFWLAGLGLLLMMASRRSRAAHAMTAPPYPLRP